MVVMMLLGFIPIWFVSPLVSLGGTPGAILTLNKNHLVSFVGLLLTVAGSCFVAGIYIVFVVGIYRWYAEIKGGIPTWPMAIAAYFHMNASIYQYISASKVELEDGKKYHTAASMIFAPTTTIFFLAVLFPAPLRFVYSWVPFFESLLS